MSRAAVVEQTERLRQIVIEARGSAAVTDQADKCLAALNSLYAKDQEAFTPEDVRWVNVLQGTLSKRLAAHTPDATKHAPKAKRKGDQLTHCWRCETPVDERFVVSCTACDSKAYHWMTCPVCQACGCQRAGGTLV